MGSFGRKAGARSPSSLSDRISPAGGSSRQFLLIAEGLMPGDRMMVDSYGNLIIRAAGERR